jgi:hypothetical protein
MRPGTKALQFEEGIIPMSDLNLTQPEADALIAMEKHRVSDERSDFPMNGQSLSLPLQSLDFGQVGRIEGAMDKMDGMDAAR